MTKQALLFVMVGLLLFAVSANAQLNPATQAVVDAAVNRQRAIDEQAYGFPCAVQPQVAMWNGATPPGTNFNCVEPDQVTAAWGCNIPGQAFVNEGKCISAPGPVPGESTLQCLEEAAAHEMTEACYGADLCDRLKATPWVVDGFELADCDYPAPGSGSAIGGCTDLACFVAQIGPVATPQPTPAGPGPTGSCICPAGSFPFGTGCFSGSNFRFFSCPAGVQSTPVPTAQPTPAPPSPQGTNDLLNLAHYLCTLSFMEQFCR